MEKKIYYTFARTYLYASLRMNPIAELTAVANAMEVSLRGRE